MIIITGAAGFVGSCLVQKLNDEGYTDLILVDDFNQEQKHRNLEGKKFKQKVDRDEFMVWLDQHHKFVQFIFHIGARTDTTEFNKEILWKLNTDYTKDLWKRCAEYGIGLVYASSAATYGLGEFGYTDDQDLIEKLVPLNPYGDSKNEFDKWALKEEKKPYFWVGLKFFNVYGPNEYHKSRMASVIYHAYNQISKTGEMKLFRSHNADYKDGEQMRDFIYVKDVVDVLFYFMLLRKKSGIYNLGSGKARTFKDLVKATFAAMGIEEKISYVDTPADIRDKYQYFTEANMQKLRSIGFSKAFHSLEEGVEDYVKNYLKNDKNM
ncbi:MAG: ADP-glyceromanno-heptose 6-epimerase [bacterium]|jgi:ADP-L-glycero-D-manno-heptose 6-epimerase